MDYVVATERLGWPPRRWWHALTDWIPGEAQMRMQYEVEPGRPTAECHLQPADDEPALCGYIMEGLIAVPGSPAWSGLHPDLRCADCSRIAGYPLEDPTEHSYRYTWDEEPTGRYAS